MPGSRALKEMCHEYEAGPKAPKAKGEGGTPADSFGETEAFESRPAEAFKGKNARLSLETAEEPEFMDYGARDFDDPTPRTSDKGSSMRSPGWSKRRPQGQAKAKSKKGYGGFF